MESCEAVRLSCSRCVEEPGDKTGSENSNKVGKKGEPGHLEVQ